MKNKLRIKDYIFLVIILAGFLLLAFQKFSGKEFDADIDEARDQQITIGGATLVVKIVANEEMKLKELQKIENIEDFGGILFAHEKPGRYIYTMRDMKFDLDFIFIRDEKVVDIAKSVSHQYKGEIKGGTEYDKVVEINADWTRKNNIKIGDVVDLGE